MESTPRRLFGVPVGDFGFFQTILVSVSLGFMAFFAGTFLSILGVSIYKGITHSPVTLDVSYKYISFPFSILVLLAASTYLMTLWVQRKRREARGA